MNIPVKVPSVGESVNEVTIGQWMKKSGDIVQLDDVLCEIESDKATVEVSSEKSGKLIILTPAGTTVPVGHIIAEIDTTATATANAAATVTAPTSVTTTASNPPPSAKDTKTADMTKVSSNGSHNLNKSPSPAAQKILSEGGVDVASVMGSGPMGRITKFDALNATSGEAPRNALPLPPLPKSTLSESAVSPNKNTSSQSGTRREKMSGLRKTIARRLVEVKNTTAMLTTFNEVDMSAVMNIRGQYKDAFKEKHQIGLGFMSFFTKAATYALLEFPSINGKIDEDEIVFHEYCDVGIAVSTPKGLVVPVVRQAQDLSLAQIEKEISRLALKARDNKLSLEDMTGGTFTITNGGVFGSMLSTPILNAPQSAILGMHNIVDRPVAVKGEVKIRPIMYLALSYDHRIVDGRESVGFLKRIKEYLEDPSRMLLGV
jgi:2-oxoglutarate dehydrogenase E2 component (dihydrolipoamide succinyltransferase)